MKRNVINTKLKTLFLITTLTLITTFGFAKNKQTTFDKSIKNDYSATPSDSIQILNKISENVFLTTQIQHQINELEYLIKLNKEKHPKILEIKKLAVKVENLESVVKACDKCLKASTRNLEELKSDLESCKIGLSNLNTEQTKLNTIFSELYSNTNKAPHYNKNDGR